MCPAKCVKVPKKAQAIEMQEINNYNYHYNYLINWELDGWYSFNKGRMRDGEVEGTYLHTLLQTNTMEYAS